MRKSQKGLPARLQGRRTSFVPVARLITSGPKLEFELGRGAASATSSLRCALSGAGVCPELGPGLGPGLGLGLGTVLSTVLSTGRGLGVIIGTGVGTGKGGGVTLGAGV